MDSYEDVQEYYARNWAPNSGEDEWPDWDDLPYETQRQVDDAFSDYNRAYIEDEERRLRPYSYYGVSR